MIDFTTALCRAIETAQADSGVRQGRLAQNVKTYGGVAAAKDYIRRGRLSDGFEALAKAGRLDLSMEALVTSSKWHDQFTDEEVNACFVLLCGENYFA